MKKILIWIMLVTVFTVAAFAAENPVTVYLDNELVEFDDTTSNQIAVITTHDLEGYDIAEYATRIGLEWQVGSEKFDNGVVIVVKPKTRSERGEVFIAVGYGLEGAIPDITAKRIIDEIMIPHFMSDDYFEGVADACTVIMKLASGEISELREGEEVKEENEDLKQENNELKKGVAFLKHYIDF